MALIAGAPRLRDNMLPFFLVVAGALTWSVGQIMIKRLGGAVDGFRLIAWVAVFSTPQLFLASWLLEDGQARAIAQAGWLGWGVVIYLGLVMTALGYGLWFRLLGRNPVSHVMPFLLLLPVVSMASGVFLLDEILTPRTLGGAALVLAGVGVILFRQGARKAASAPEAIPPGD